MRNKRWRSKNSRMKSLKSLKRKSSVKMTSKEANVVKKTTTAMEEKMTMSQEKMI